MSKRKESGMKLLFINEGRECSIGALTFDEWRSFMAEYMSTNPAADRAWDVMGCVRGPDSPSERPDMNSAESSKAYSGRRERKHQTVEVLREAMFFGAMGGAARHHVDDKVTVNSEEHQDHFDRHVVRAARALGLKVIRK